MAEQIHVSILSDSRLYREAIALRLAFEKGLKPVTAAATPYELLRRARTCPIDVLLVHSRGEAEEAAEAIWKAKALLPGVCVIVVGDADHAANVVQWLEAGAVACLNDDVPCSRLVDAIRAVGEGRTVVSSRILGRLFHRIGERVEANRHAQGQDPDPLSAREAEIAQLVASGLANKQIARRLDVRLPTVKSHVHNIMRKLQIKRRRDIIRRAYHPGRLEEG